MACLSETQILAPLCTEVEWHRHSCLCSREHDFERKGTVIGRKTPIMGRFKQAASASEDFIYRQARSLWLQFISNLKFPISNRGSGLDLDSRSRAFGRQNPVRPQVFNHLAVMICGVSQRTDQHSRASPGSLGGRAACC